MDNPIKTRKEGGILEVTLDRPHLVSVVLSSEKQLEAQHVDELKRVITERAGEPIVLEVQSNIRR